MNQPGITVYSYRRCPFAIRVRMTLHEKNIPFDIQEEDLKNFSTELRAIHPEAKVPALRHGELTLYESAVITEYLDETFPQPPLMPEDPSQRANVRLWTYWCNHSFKSDIDRFKYGTSRFDADEIEPATKRLYDHLNKLETCLRAQPFLLGDNISLADIHVFPFYRQLSRTTPSHPRVSECDHTNRWLDTIVSRPSFEKTMAKAEKK